MTAAALREKHDGALGDGSAVTLWLRLLSCATIIEKRVRSRLASRFGATLPRFDVLAALDRTPEGMTMGALSRSLLVSNGNVTGIVRALAEEGLVRMAPSPTDGRASIVQLTEDGARSFAIMAEAHHGWIETMLSGLDRGEREALYELLGILKASIAAEEDAA